MTDDDSDGRKDIGAGGGAPRPPHNGNGQDGVIRFPGSGRGQGETEAPITGPWVRGDQQSPRRPRPPDAGPPPPMSLRGAPITTALLIGLAIIELGALLSIELRAWLTEMAALNPAVLLAIGNGASPAAASAFVSYGVLHGGVAHLGFNLAALAILGPPLERTTGLVGFALLCVLGTILGGAAHVAFEIGRVMAQGYDPFTAGFFIESTPRGLQCGILRRTDGGADALLSLCTPLVGASGFISGVLAADLRRREFMRVAAGMESRRDAWRWFFGVAVLFIAANLAISLLDGFISGAAHVGGFLAGAWLAPRVLQRLDDPYARSRF